MNIFLYLIAPHTKRNLVSTLADLKVCATDENEAINEHQAEVMTFFNDADDIQDAVNKLAAGESYMGYDESGEYCVGISSTSPDAAKLVALEQLIIDMEEAEDH
jgi:hypothetical protein